MRETPQRWFKKGTVYDGGHKSDELRYLGIVYPAPIFFFLGLALPGVPTNQKASAVSGDQMSSEIRVCLQCKGRIGSMRGARAKFCAGIWYQRNVKQVGKELRLSRLSTKAKKKGSVLFHDCIFGGGGGIDPVGALAFLVVNATSGPANSAEPVTKQDTRNHAPEEKVKWL